MKLLRRLVLVLTTTAVLVAAAVPAWATENVPEVDEERAWFYWLAPVLVLSVLGLLGLLALGYFLQVLRPKLRGR